MKNKNTIIAAIAVLVVIGIVGVVAYSSGGNNFTGSISNISKLKPSTPIVNPVGNRTGVNILPVVVTASAPYANKPMVFAENQTNPIYAFTLTSTNGNATLQDMTVNLSTTGELLPVDSAALYTAPSSGACSTATLLKDYESVVASSATAGSGGFTNINKALSNSQDVYLCVFLRSKTVVSGTPVPNTNIALRKIIFDKVLDSNGNVLSVTPLIPAVSPSVFIP